MTKNPFWHSATVLLRYKRQLAVALSGALLSAACFGAGLSMVLPAIVLFLYQQRTLSEVILKYVGGPKKPQAVQEFAQWLAANVPSDRYRSFVLVMCVLIVLTVVGSLGRYIHELLIVTVVSRVSMLWRNRVFGRLIHSPVQQLLRSGTADYISRMTSDINVLAGGYNAILDNTVAALLNGAVALMVALILNWQLTAIALLEAPLVAIMLRKFGKRIRRASKKAMQKRGSMVGVLKEALGGIMVVKVHNAEGFERRRFGRATRTVFGQEMRMRQAKALSGPMIDTLQIVGMAAASAVAAWYIFRRGVEPEKFMTVLASLAGAAASLKPLSSLNTQLSESNAAAERILEAMAVEVEPTGVDARRDAVILPRHGRDVRFESVTFSYPGQAQPAVRDVSLSVSFGQTVAVVGANGSGKTTLLSMLPRLLAPEKGRVIIDGADIADVNLRALRQQMAVVTQQTVLFQGTISDNIAYARRYTPRDKVIAAAKAAFADEFIATLPQGYDALLGEDGTGLSGGQRQRLARTARAILRDPAILILDEATSQIDADSEAKINRALKQLRQGRTTFVIAHRLSTVVDADLIVVMSDGVILDQGKHRELLERCAVYQLLTQTQLQPSAT